MPVRVGAAQASLPISGLSRNLQMPGYATSVGLLLWGMKEDARAVHRRFEADHGSGNATRPYVRRGERLAQEPVAGQGLR